MKLFNGASCGRINHGLIKENNMYEIFIEDSFSAAHQIRKYGGNCEKLHGHNWKVKVFVKTEKLDKRGIGIDFRELKNKVKEILSLVDHKDLGEISPFDEENPTSENIARFIFGKLSNNINSGNLKVSKIKVHETPGTGVIYSE